MAEEVVSENGSGDATSASVEKKDDNKEPTVLEQKIINQIEYYFGDINLTRDKFLQEQVKLEEGWVPLDIMLKFNRLNRLTTEPEVITTALAKSTSGLMEINDEKSKIRRTPNRPLPEMNEERREELATRTVYCKGFNLLNTTIAELLDFFPQFGKIENVIMRNYQDKATQTWKFKGSVYVVFSTVAETEAFLKLESVKYEDTELIRKKQSDYLEGKRKERIEEKLKHKAKVEEAVEEEKEDDALPSGTIVHLKGIITNITREDIKEKVEGFGIPVAFIDFSKGDEEGWIRLEQADAAKTLIEKIKEEDGKLKVKEAEIEVVALEGKEETEYLDKAKRDMQKRRQSAKRGRRGRGGRGRGNMRKRKGSPSRDGPPAKVKADVS